MTQNWQEQDLPPELREQMRRLATDGAARLGDLGNASPADVVARIHERVGSIRPLGGGDLDGESTALGCLWGEQICAAHGWTWVILTRADEEAYAIVPPDRRFSIFPTIFMHSKLKDRGAENTVRLVFDLLAAGDLPDVAPGTYALLN
jgi:hypothetical protein